LFLSRRRLVLIGTVAVIVGVIVLLPLILTITLPDLGAVDITVKNIELQDISDDNIATLKVIFNIKNPTGQALTTSKIDYDLSANGESIGDFTKSYIDIPLNGRPQLLSNTDTNISSVIETPILDEKIRADIRNNNQSLQNIEWTINGNAIIESGFSSAPKIFNATW
jgi:LEA14-like dessication related protein